ncbi:MAG: hypothetical protein LBQ64_01270, partial [Bacteroidales bacterium]|nr:hypothetical protein [Bacteroidales bacterium]
CKAEKCSKLLFDSLPCVENTVKLKFCRFSRQETPSYRFYPDKDAAENNPLRYLCRFFAVGLPVELPLGMHTEP